MNFGLLVWEAGILWSLWGSLQDPWWGVVGGPGPCVDLHLLVERRGWVVVLVRVPRLVLVS